MRADIIKTIKDHYNVAIPMTNPDYYITDEYHRYRLALANLFNNHTLIESLYKAAILAFPDEELDVLVDLVHSPGFSIFQNMPDTFEEYMAKADPRPGETLYEFTLFFSGIGPYWHMAVNSSVGQEDETVDDYIESSIPRQFAAGHSRLARRLKQLGYRELSFKEAWEPVRLVVHDPIPPEMLRVGHLLFSPIEPFGVPNFETIMLGLDRLGDLALNSLFGPEGEEDEGLDDDEPWMGEPEKPRTIH